MTRDEDRGEWHLPFYLFVTRYRRCKVSFVAMQTQHQPHVRA